METESPPFEQDGGRSTPSDLELLASALVEAVDAHQAGLVIGPAVDEVALRRAERKARRADAARRLTGVDLDGVA